MKNKLKFLLIGFIGIYIIITLINQQKVLNSYANVQESLALQISEQKNYQEELKVSSQKINSEEYIEEIAREKLGMYKTNERVYVNIGN